MNRDDRDWIDLLSRGDGEGFRAFVDHHKRQVYGLALDLTGNHHDAEDLAQEVFVRVLQSVDRFRGDAKLSSWLYRITVNLNIDRVRRKRPDVMDHEGLEQIHAVSPTRPSRDAGHDAAMAEAGDRIEAALDTLSDQQRTVFVLKHHHDLPLREVADILGVSIGTVKSSLFRAIRALRDRLAPYREDLGLESES